MSKIILFLLVFAVGTLAYRGWQYLGKARKRDINGKIERGRRTQARMEKPGPIQHYPKEYADKYGNRIRAWDDTLREIENGGPT